MTCLNAYDTITQADGTVINHFDYADSAHTVTSYCRVANGTWVAWINKDLGAETAATSQAQRLLDKESWRSDVASAVAIGVAYFPDDGTAPTAYELGVDPAFVWESAGLYSGRDPCGVYPLLGDKYSDNTQSIMTAWLMNVLDVQVRTDGTNVWVVVLARESVKYPFLYGGSHVDRCGHSHPTLEQDYAAEGGDAFNHDTDTGNRWWEYFEGSLGGGDMPFGAYDDPGPDNSFRWQPARVTVFAGDLGGFTLLDHVDAQFANNKPTGLCGDIESCASPNEPGVLHLMWAEAGDFGVQTVSPQRGQRINYTRWDNTAKILDTDLKYTSEAGSGYISDANWVWTAEYILRNDHGSPIAVVWPWIAVSGPQGPTTTAEFWDLSGGTPDVLQTLDASLIPTVAETGLDFVEQTGVLYNPEAIASVGGPQRSQFCSSLYTDPTLGDVDVYLICSSYQDGVRGAVAFYRIPCDGSETFSFLDGNREVMYSIVPTTGLGRSGFTSDFVSDPDDVWIPALVPLATLGGAVFQLDRQCKRGWNLLPAFPILDPHSGYEDGHWHLGTSPPSLVTDDAGDWIYGGGYGPILTSDSTKPTNIAAIKAKICRCCEPCVRNLHIWQRF